MGCYASDTIYIHVIRYCHIYNDLYVSNTSTHEVISNDFLNDATPDRLPGRAP